MTFIFEKREAVTTLSTEITDVIKKFYIVSKNKDNSLNLYDLVHNSLNVILASFMCALVKEKFHQNKIEEFSEQLVKNVKIALEGK